MEGVLLKWTNYIFGWRERFFVLKGNVLYYYYQRGEKPRGRFHLAVCQIIEGESDIKFEIDTGVNIVYIKAENKDVRDQWIQALKVAKLDGENKMQSNFNFNASVNSINMSNVNSFNSNKNDGSEFGTNRNSLVTEDKLLRKINSISKSVEKLMSDNENFNRIVNRSANPELTRMLKDYKVSNMFN
jgi:hypothetical protein